MQFSTLTESKSNQIIVSKEVKKALGKIKLHDLKREGILKMFY